MRNRMPNFTAYNIKTDRWHRKWQAEWDDPLVISSDMCFAACRAYTRNGAIRKCKRWYKNGTDVKRARRMHRRDGVIVTL